MHETWAVRKKDIDFFRTVLNEAYVLMCFYRQYNVVLNNTVSKRNPKNTFLHIYDAVGSFEVNTKHDWKVIYDFANTSILRRFEGLLLVEDIFLQTTIFKMCRTRIDVSMNNVCWSNVLKCFSEIVQVNDITVTATRNEWNRYV